MFFPFFLPMFHRLLFRIVHKHYFNNQFVIINWITELRCVLNHGLFKCFIHLIWTLLFNIFITQCKYEKCFIKRTTISVSHGKNHIWLESIYLSIYLSGKSSFNELLKVKTSFPQPPRVQHEDNHPYCFSLSFMHFIR